MRFLFLQGILKEILFYFSFWEFVWSSLNVTLLTATVNYTATSTHRWAIKRSKAKCIIHKSWLHIFQAQRTNNHWSFTTFQNLAAGKYSTTIQAKESCPAPATSMPDDIALAFRKWPQSILQYKLVVKSNCLDSSTTRQWVHLGGTVDGIN